MFQILTLLIKFKELILLAQGKEVGRGADLVVAKVVDKAALV